MQQPGAVFYVRFVRLVVRLITAAGQLFSVSKLHRKSKLLCLRRVNIEKRRFMPKNFFFLSVLHLDQMQLFVQKSGMLSGQQCLRQITQQSDQLVVRVQRHIMCDRALRHLLTDHPHHPKNSKKMIHVLVCHKDSVDII